MPPLRQCGARSARALHDAKLAFQSVSGEMTEGNKVHPAEEEEEGTTQAEKDQPVSVIE